MSLTQQEMTLLGRLLREAVRDHSYQETPLGRIVRRYLRWKRMEQGASPITVSDYERHLAQLCLHFPTHEPRDLEPPAGTELLREFIAKAWGGVAPATRAKRISILHDFFDWVTGDQQLMEVDPSRRIRRPSIPDPDRDMLTQEDAAAIIRVCARRRDLIAASLLLDLGLRKGELRGIRMGDAIDGNIHVRGKGSRTRTVPIADPLLNAAIETHQLETGPDDYLLHPEKWTSSTNRAAGRGREDLAGKILLWSDPQRQLSNTRTHEWWKQLLQRAGVAHRRMHAGRHFALTTLWRATGDLEIVRAIAGHKSVSTTQIYVHSTVEDIEWAMRRAQSFRSNTEAERLN
jgi:integrase/recombinase XerD